MSEMPFKPQLCGGEIRPDELDEYERTGDYVFEEKYD